MSFMIIGDTIHKNPPQNSCNASNGQIVEEFPENKEKCDICFGLPR